MKKQCMNPYLPLWEFIPDGEPRVFHDRLYVFGSHDREHGSEFCELDYVAWSAPVDDMADWRFEGVIYRKDQDPYNHELLPLYAPDVIQGVDGRYYLYYCVKFQNAISVAVCDTPAGEYQYLGRVHYEDGRTLTEGQPYDPSVIVDGGSVYLYYGFSPCQLNISRYLEQDLKGCSVVVLERDMLTVQRGPKIVLPSLRYAKGTSFEEDPYFEAPSIRKINEEWYLVYSSVRTHRLCYARSHDPLSGFVYGGCIISNGDVGYRGRLEADKVMSVGNNHGGLVQVGEQWYIFYHRHTSTTQYNRQGCAEPIWFDAEGNIPQVPVTTSGMNAKPLSGRGRYPAVYCCNLTNGRMGTLNSLGRINNEVEFPYITERDNVRYLTNLSNCTMVGYKYLNLHETKNIALLYRSNSGGVVDIKTAEIGEARATIALKSSAVWTQADVAVGFLPEDNELFLYFREFTKADLLEVVLS